MTRPVLKRMCPFFIVSNVAQSIAFYRGRLGFETWYQEPDDEPFFAVVGRDGAQLFLKAGEAAPMPNPTRDPAMRWDAYVLAVDPDSIAAEFADRGVAPVVQQALPSKGAGECLDHGRVGVRRDRG